MLIKHWPNWKADNVSEVLPHSCEKFMLRVCYVTSEFLKHIRVNENLFAWSMTDCICQLSLLASRLVLDFWVLNLSEVESSRTSLASRTSSRTHFEVLGLGLGLEGQVLGLGLGLETSSPRKLPCPRLEDSTSF